MEDKLQYKVPQKIDMEDKIIGPLTLKQFTYLMVGGMITYATIKSYNITLFLFFGLPVGLIALALAFIKVQDQPFSKFLLSLTMYFIKPRSRIWSKDWQMKFEQKEIVQKTKKEKPKEVSKHISKSEIEKLSVVLDTKGEEKIKNIK